MKQSNEPSIIITESGNNFHCEVVSAMKQQGWNTLVSPYYMNSISNKPREIDLIAEKAIPFRHNFKDLSGTINIKLFIECKYISQKVVFWFDDKDISSARKWLLRNTPLHGNNMFLEEHSYISRNSRVAKLFSSRVKGTQENDVIYKALNQSLNSMVFLRKKGSIIHDQGIITSFAIP